MNFEMFATFDYTTVSITILGIAGTLAAALFTQSGARQQMKDDHDFQSTEEYARWMRDRRADLYVRISTLYRRALNLTELRVSRLRSFLAVGAELGKLADMSKEVSDRTDHQSADEVASLLAILNEKQPEVDRLLVEADRLKAELDGLLSDFDKFVNQISDQMMELDLFGSPTIQGLAGAVFDEINKIGKELTDRTDSGKSDMKPLNQKWGDLHAAMRKELKVPV